MHDHARHTLATLPAPERGSTSRFWIGNDQYTIQPDGLRWMVYFIRPHLRKASPLITLELREDGTWLGIDVDDFDQYTGATHIDVLRQVT